MLGRSIVSVSLWFLACQASPSVGFSRQEYWSGLLFPSSGDLPDPGIEPKFPVSPALQADSLAAETSGKPVICVVPGKRHCFCSSQKTLNHCSSLWPECFQPRFLAVPDFASCRNSVIPSQDTKWHHFLVDLEDQLAPKMYLKKLNECNFSVKLLEQASYTWRQV